MKRKTRIIVLASAICGLLLFLYLQSGNGKKETTDIEASETTEENREAEESAGIIVPAPERLRQKRQEVVADVIRFS